MSFEEDYPSLCKFFTEDKMPIPEVFYISVVEQCCLDKQKVRETIEERIKSCENIKLVCIEENYYTTIDRLDATILELQILLSYLGVKGDE